MVHTKCRQGLYPLSQVARIQIIDNQTPWTIALKDYEPPEYNSPILQNKPWADPPISENKFTTIQWNQVDGGVNRKSHTGIYNIVDNRPQNPSGRTGIKGRGVLGRWGPNHAADPIVTRWKLLNDQKVINYESKNPILQFCAIQRRDNNEWAIPGGMVDPGEAVSETLKREFLEEAFNSLEQNDENEVNGALIRNFFENGGVEVYRGYVDDPRNTDNAWMETIAVNFHDENNSTVGKFKLQAGDDAKSVRWVDIDKHLALYASHLSFIKKVVEIRQAHW